MTALFKELSVENIRYARIASANTDGDAEIEILTERPIAATRATLFRNGTAIATAAVERSDKDECAAVARFALGEIDPSARYFIALDGGTPVAVNFVPLIDTEYFISRFESADAQSVRLGATYTKEKTVLALWAPFAESVKLKLYASGTADRSNSVAMEKLVTDGAWHGVWQKTLDGDRAGEHYTFCVTNFGRTTETIDPYAKACNANGMRGIIADMSETDPAGWKNDKILALTNPVAADTPIIWETSVKDFSSSADSGMLYKGKFKAFTEHGTTVPGTALKTGADYLKELGVTYVHLNPVYDFATVDEAECNKADNTVDAYNWGYDPQNYNIPEGSYATVADGVTRIKELKQAIAALHAAGIGVIMDVVYNHTYTTGGQALNDTAPKYYHRTDGRGAFTNDSGCGNGTASERTMMRKYMVESVLYWAKEYHLDGFRFDLMGIHDVITLNTVRAELDKLWGGAGKKILVYGEPWSADGDYIPASYTARIKVTKNHIAGTGEYTDNADNRLIKEVFADGFTSETAFDALSERIAVFNGSGRDGLRGACWDKTPCAGWVNGAPAEVQKVKRMIEGGIGGFGSGLHLGTGSRNVAYAAAHDNYTLWDHIRGAKHGDASALFYDDPNADDIKRCKLVSAAYMMSTGICFMLAGEEFARTKYGNEDSYNSPAKLNAISWSRRREFAGLFAHYKRLIELRKKYAAQLFSYDKSAAKEYAYGHFVQADEEGRIVFRREKNGVALVLELDPASLRGKITIGEDVYEF